MGTLGVYIQVPFCQTKCSYCNFHTAVVSAGRFGPYVAAVDREIRGCRESLSAAGLPYRPGSHTHPNSSCHPEVAPFAGAGSAFLTKQRAPFWGIHLEGEQDAIVDTVYIGGGTPSLLEPDLLTRVMHAIRQTFSCELREVTLEADPETIEANRAAAWVAAGFNRISLGTQSFVDDELQAVGRMHRRVDIFRAVALLRAAGIANISFDLIAGLPKQTSASWDQSLAESVALRPEHVSIYMMEIDDASRLGLEVLQGGARYSARDLPSEESMAEYYETGQSVMKAAGYVQYEISNWAKPGRESLHNLKYWRREPYLGFGAGAHSFSGSNRWANVHDAAEYVKRLEAGGNAVESVDQVTPKMALEEEVFLGLRKSDGIDVRWIEQCYEVALEEKVERLLGAGMVEFEGNRVRVPESKFSVSNEVMVELLR